MQRQEITWNIWTDVFSCLRLVIINFEQVQAMRDQTIYFENGKSFALGRTNYISTKQAFAAYLKKLPM